MQACKHLQAYVGVFFLLFKSSVIRHPNFFGRSRFSRPSDTLAFFRGVLGCFVLFFLLLLFFSMIPMVFFFPSRETPLFPNEYTLVYVFGHRVFFFSLCFSFFSFLFLLETFISERKHVLFSFFPSVP